METFLDTQPYEPSMEIRHPSLPWIAPWITDFTIRMLVKEPCPPMWGIVIGEILHDIRSALDHLIYQLVIYATDTAPGDRSRTQFPIFDDNNEYAKHRPKMLKGVGSKATALIEAFQPFSTGESTSSPLWHLNELSNVDKHRTLHLTGGTLEEYKFDFPPVIFPGRKIEERMTKRAAFEHNSIVVEGRFVSDAPMFEEPVVMTAGIRFDIVFDQRTPGVPEWSVIRTLLAIADRTQDCVKSLCHEVLAVQFEVPQA
jgi:hypothetical protein